MCHDDTFKLLLKTLLKELSTNKGEILCRKFVSPYKNQKTLGSIMREQEHKSGSNSPPFQGNVQIPLLLGTMHTHMPGGRGMLELQFDRYIMLRQLFG